MDTPPPADALEEMPAAAPVTRKGEYARHGDFHRHLNPNWNYYPIYLNKLEVIDDVLRRHPVALGRMAVLHTEAALAADRNGLATARAELGKVLPPEAVEASLLMLERESARLLSLSRSVRLVDEALRGARFRPRL